MKKSKSIPTAIKEKKDIKEDIEDIEDIKNLEKKEKGHEKEIKSKIKRNDNRPIVENIEFKKEKIDLNSVDGKECEKYFDAANKILKQSKMHIKDLLPIKPRETLAFSIYNGSSELANAIRISLIDESFPIKSMTFDDDDIKTTDKYILTDKLKKDIELVPINQDEDLHDTLRNMRMYVEIANDTPSNINVFVKDIKIENEKKGNKEKKQDLLERLFPSPYIIISKLKSGNYLKINKIKIDEGIGLENSGKFSCTANVTYEELHDSNDDNNDNDSNDGNNDNEENINEYYKVNSIYSYQPKNYRISFTTHRNMNAYLLIKKCIETLILRLKEVKETIIESNNDVVVTDRLEITKLTDELWIFRFFQENGTIIRLIKKYLHLESDSKLPFVVACDTNQILKNEFILKIKYNGFPNIIYKAIDRAIEDLNNISKTIAKK
jgi:hypothetical protein